MDINCGKILIIDEAGFSRVCSAILEAEGYRAETLTEVDQQAALLNGGSFSLVITSYPFGSSFFDEIRKRSLPTLILTDHISKDLLSTLELLNNSLCMIKPLDYQKFKNLVRQLIAGDFAIQGGYSIV